MSKIDRSFQEIEQNSSLIDSKYIISADIYIFEKYEGYAVDVFIYSKGKGNMAIRERQVIRRKEEIREVEEYLKNEKVSLIEIIFYDDSENNEKYRFKERDNTRLKRILEYRLFGISPSF